MWVGEAESKMKYMSRDELFAPNEGGEWKKVARVPERHPPHWKKSPISPLLFSKYVLRMLWLRLKGLPSSILLSFLAAFTPSENAREGAGGVTLENGRSLVLRRAICKQWSVEGGIKEPLSAF